MHPLNKNTISMKSFGSVPTIREVPLLKDSPGFPSAILLAVVLAYNHQYTLHVVFLLLAHVLSQNRLGTTRI